MCVQSPRTILQDHEYFKFNGKRITDIYAVYENSRYATKKEGGGYIADILYYDCHVHRWDCGKDILGKDRGKSILKVKDLPKEFKGLFGMVENKGKKVFVHYLSIRERDSANGSFTDETLDLNGWSSNSTTGSFGLYRGCDFMEKPENTYVINEKSVLGKKITDLFGKSFKVKEVEFAEIGAKMKEGSLDFATKYPYAHTPIRFIDGLVYPDEKLPSWRWLFGMPYRTPDNAKDKEFGIGRDRKHIRVWDEKLKAHLYLEQVEAQQGDEGLLFVSFSSERHELYGTKGSAYCTVRRFNETYGYEYVRHNITKVDKQHWNVEYETYRDGKKIDKKQRTFQGMFYRLNRVVNSNHKED